MPKSTPRITLIALTLLCLGGADLGAQTGATATISGRVVLDGTDGMRGAVVALLPSTPSGPRVLGRAKTDADGRYVLSGVPAGRYWVAPLAAAYIIVGRADASRPGQQVIVAAGESVEGIDFRLVRGGVITGRVTDADGRPLIREAVNLSAVGVQRLEEVVRIDPHRLRTDDRGVYRIYGLPAGGYRVSAGADPDGGDGRVGPSGFFRRVYYPDSAHEAEAKVIEVKAGEEVTGIDIVLGRPAKTFQVSGRVLRAEGGEPVSGVRLIYGVARQGEAGQLWVGGTISDARGEFRLGRLNPGRYAVYPTPDGAAEWYGEGARFEVGGSDVGGLVIKLRRGASLSGSVQIEGTSDPARRARLMAQAVLSISYEPTGGPAVPSFSPPLRPGPDGSFQVGGLRPGRVRLTTGWPPVKGLTLLRIEHEGADRSAGLELEEGARVVGVRAVYAYGDAAVRGQVTVINGVLPPQARLVVILLRPGGTGHFLGRPADVDARGRFTVEGLPSGDYELVVRAFGQGTRAREVRHQVTLPEDGETNVSLTLDLGDENN